MTKPQHPNLQHTVANTILIININNSNNFKSYELPYSHARLTSIKFTKQQSVSQSVSQSVGDKHNQWSDSGPIINLDWTFWDSTAVSIFVVISRRQCCLDYLWRNIIPRYICANDTLWEKQVFSHLSILVGKLLSSLPSAIQRQNEKQTDDTLSVNMFFRRKKFNAKSWRKRWIIQTT